MRTRVLLAQEDINDFNSGDVLCSEECLVDLFTSGGLESVVGRGRFLVSFVCVSKLVQVTVCQIIISKGYKVKREQRLYGLLTSGQDSTSEF